MISNGSASAAMTINSEMPRFSVFVAIITITCNSTLQVSDTLKMYIQVVQLKTYSYTISPQWYIFGSPGRTHGPPKYEMLSGTDPHPCAKFQPHPFSSYEGKEKERIVLREIHLRTKGRHLSMGSHSVICHPTEVTAPPSPQPGRLVLDLSTP